MVVLKLLRVNMCLLEDAHVVVHLLHEWQHIIGSPTLCLPRIIVGTLATSVYHPING